MIPWLSTSADDAGSRITNPNAGPIRTAGGFEIAQNVADLANCTKGPSGTDCLLAQIDLDISGKEVDALTWSGTLPDGTADSPNCSDWTSNSASDEGGGGLTDNIDAGWSTGVQGSCDQRRHLICFHFE
jgi:hypothetical protein